MSKAANIACLQIRPKPDFRSALVEALDLAKVAVSGGADMLCLPEYCGGLRTDAGLIVPPAASENEHPVLLELREFAKQNSVWMVIGSLAVPGPGGKIRNRGFVVDDEGEVKARYDKIHMFDVELNEHETYRESVRVAPGNRAVIVDTPFGRLGYTICYDLRFPTLYRELAQAGADILLTPAAFTRRTGEAHWHVLNRARAIENGAFVVAPCSVGRVDGGGDSYGHSLVVNPWGEVLADGGDRPGVVHAIIDSAEVARVRKQIPSLRHDRTYKMEFDCAREVA